MSSTANDILMGGGIPSAKFERPGDTVTGTIDGDPQATQQTDFTTGEPLTWPNGDPRMQIVVTLATGKRDDDEDDGLRKVYIKGKSLTGAVRDAVRKAGAKGIEAGGQLSVTYTGDGVSEKRGINPPKLYTATYTPPKAAAVNAVLDQPEPGHDPADPASARFVEPSPTAPDESALQAALANLSPEVKAALLAQSKSG